MNKITLIGNYDVAQNTMTCKRLSNNYDVLPVIFPDIVKKPNKSGSFKFEGSIINDKGNVHVEVYQVEEITEDIQNTTACELKGIIKKLYPVRVTKKNHKLQDMLVEADGQLVKVVAFEPCPEFIVVGLKVRVRGRLQSRAFTQLTTFGTLSKVVYEVALKNLETIEDNNNDFDPFDMAEDIFEGLDNLMDPVPQEEANGDNN